MKTTKRNKVKPAKGKRISAARLVELTPYAKSTISAWTADGTLTRGKDGLYDQLASLQAIAIHEEERDNDGNAVSSNRSEISALRADLLRERIIGAKHENAAAAGLVHSKEDCCQSLTAILSVTSREFIGLGRTIGTKFPEVGSALVAAIDKEIAEKLCRLKYGLAYRGEYFCPKCNAKIDECRVEPFPEDKL